MSKLCLIHFAFSLRFYKIYLFPCLNEFYYFKEKENDFIHGIFMFYEGLLNVESFIPYYY